MIRRGLEAIADRAALLMAGALVAGFAIPAVSDLFRSVILHAIVVVLTVAMIRLDVERFRAYARRPATLAAIAAVNMIAAPLFAWAALRLFHAPTGLEQGLILMAAAPMISSAIALAAILELDTALAVAVMVATYAVTPLTLPALSLWLIDLEIDAGEIFARLFGLVVGPALAAFVLRRWRPVRSARYARAIDGIGVLAVMVFCLGITSGLQNFALENPGYAGLTLAAAFAANICLQAFGAAIFLRLGRREALTVGLVTGNTNLGLVMVTLADRASPELVAYFVLGQAPMYFLPVVAVPVYRRLMRE